MGPSASGADPLGDPEVTEFWRQLVRIHPSNLEDPAHDRYEKPRYREASDMIEAAARRWGLSVRRYDPNDGPSPDPRLRGLARPNLIIDLPGEGAERVLVLAHYDVVPVPAEQLDRWKSPPTELTRRENGRWYGRAPTTISAAGSSARSGR